MWIPVQSSPMNAPRINAEVKPGEVVSVSWLNRAAREALEGSFPLMWIAGEVSTLTRAASDITNSRLGLAVAVDTVTPCDAVGVGSVSTHRRPRGACGCRVSACRISRWWRRTRP